MSYDYTRAAWEARFELSTKLVLLCLAEHAGQHGLSWVSIDRIMYLCNLSKTSVYEGISQLVKAGWLVKGKAKVAKLVADGFMDESNIRNPEAMLSYWRLTPHFPDSGKSESVQKSVNAVPDSGKEIPDSGKICPDSGKPPHPLIGRNHQGTTMEPSSAPSAGVTVKNGQGSFFKLSGSIEQDKRAIIRRVFAYYGERTEHSSLYTLTEPRMKYGLARLEDALSMCGNSPDKAEELLRIAVDAIAASEFHMGKNDNKRRYNDWIDHLFKSREKFEKWLESDQ